MKKLVVLVDGSIYSQSVCDHAAWVAQKTGAEVELIHVLGRREVTAVKPNLSGNITLGARTALLNELSELDAQRAQLAQKIGRAILEDAHERLLERGATKVSVRLRIEDIVETVAEHEADADIVVVGKRGEAADFARLHLGSNLERIVRSSTKPVLVTSRAFKPIESFLIAFDGGTSTQKAVDYVARSPLFSGLKCKLLMVGADRPENRNDLENARTMLAAGSFEVEAEIRPGQPEAVISQAVETQNIDLLVMGAYGHTRIRRMIIGSSTSEMIRLCKIPVFLFR